MSRTRGESWRDPKPPDVVRWTAGCLVATAATVGVVILVFLVAIALQPPVWVQVTLGIGLAIGGAFFAWLVASALGQARGPDRSIRSVSRDDRDASDEVRPAGDPDDLRREGGSAR